MVLTQDIRGLLADRVERKLAGRRVKRAVIDAAVERVVAALAKAPPTPNEDALVMALSAASLPDLASRVSAALARGGIVPLEMAHARAGRHAVVTMRVTMAQRGPVEGIAAELGARATALSAGELA